MKPQSAMALRRRSRELFPTWSIRMRAKWVWATLTYHPRVPMSTAANVNDRHFKFTRVYRVK